MPGELPDYLEGTQKAYAAGYTAGLLAGLIRAHNELAPAAARRVSDPDWWMAYGRNLAALMEHVQRTGELPEEA
jgi:hypothetical protein